MSNRLAYASDGTRLFSIAEDQLTERADLLATLADEAADIYLNGGATQWALVFPSPRCIDGLFLSTMTAPAPAGYTVSAFTMEVSADSTNGQDGTWVSAISGVIVYYPDQWNAPRLLFPATSSDSTDDLFPQMRSVAAVRFTTEDPLLSVHLFGTVLAVGDHLQLWNPVLETEVPEDLFDFGAVGRGSSQDVVFRVKNMSQFYTATAVTVSLAPSADTVPSVAAQHFLAAPDDEVFRATADLGDLGPRQVSDPLTLRRVTATNATAGMWAAQVRARAASWALDAVVPVAVEV